MYFQYADRFHNALTEEWKSGGFNERRMNFSCKWKSERWQNGNVSLSTTKVRGESLLAEVFSLLRSYEKPPTMDILRSLRGLQSLKNKLKNNLEVDVLLNWSFRGFRLKSLFSEYFCNESLISSRDFSEGDVKMDGIQLHFHWF